MAHKTHGLLWKEVALAVVECNSSFLLNGGEEMGMTNEQYKGMLLDQLEAWERILGMFGKVEDAEIQKEVEKQIAKTNEKLKF